MASSKRPLRAGLNRVPPGVPLDHPFGADVGGGGTFGGEFLENYVPGEFDDPALHAEPEDVDHPVGDYYAGPQYPPYEP